ncbi:MAG: ABC transporter ATP-binding protein [Pseudomonadota bacterium]
MLNDIKKTLHVISPHLFVKENTSTIIAALSMMAASTATNFFASYILTEMVKVDNHDDDIKNSAKLNATFEELIVLFVAAIIISRTLQSWRRTITNPLISNTAFSLIFAIITHFINLSHSYFAKAPIGAISEHFNTASLGAQDLTAQLFNQIIPVSLESLAAMGVAFYRFGFIPGLIFVGMFMTYIVYNISFAKYIAETQKETVKTRGAMTRAITSSLQNYEAIHLFNNVDYELSKVNEKLTAVKKANTLSLSLPDKIAIGQWLIIGIGFGSILASSYKSVPFNDFIGLCFYLLLYINLFSSFGDGISKARAACINLSEIANIFAINPEVSDNYSSALLADNAAIEFKNVSFHYDIEKGNVLNNLSFQVHHGEKVGIVGSSGAGKSTVARLLYRFYDYQQGEITINNQKINQVSLRSLRSAIAIVPQMATLFNDSLKNNIWYGAISKYSETIDYNILLQVLNTADLNAFSGRLDINVGERGAKISGGQGQRISIARALIKEAPILIFDEATSALDAKTEQVVQHNLNQAARGKTTLIISHKLYNVKEADRIIVLQNGSKVEEGSHEVLLALKGHYYSMWQKQSQEYGQQPALDDGNHELEWAKDSQPMQKSHQVDRHSIGASNNNSNGVTLTMLRGILGQPPASSLHHSLMEGDEMRIKAGNS